MSGTILNLDVFEQRFRNIFKEAPFSAALLSGDNFIIEMANEATLLLWGRNESIIGKPLLTAMPEMEGQEAYEALKGVYNTGEIFEGKERTAYLTSNGTQRKAYVNYVFKPIRDDAGDKVVGVLAVGYDVTDQVLAKQKLTQSEETVRQLFMQAPIGIGVLKGESLFIELVNDAMLAYWKRTREEVINRPLWDVFPEIASQGFSEITAKVFHTGEAYYSPETPVDMVRNGTLEQLYIHFAFEPLRDEEGKVIGLLSIGNEVTDLVMARKRSEVNEARLQNLADSMPQLVWIADEKGKVTYYNNRITNFEGAYKTDKGTWEWKGILHPEDLDRTRDAWHKAVHDKKTYEIEHRVKMTDGTFRWHLSRAIPQRDGEGKMTWYGTATDIQQVKDAETAIRESEEKFRIMADATPTIIWALTPAGTHRYLNRFAIQYLGILDDVVPVLSWDAHIHPDDVESTRRVLGTAFRNSTPYKHEHRLRRHDGEYRWFLSQGAPTYYSNGELYGYVGSGTDVHEWRLAQELVRKNEEMLENLVKERTLELQRSNDDLQQFAHVASHDLKEPIRKIKTFSYKLQDEFGTQLNDRANSLLNKIISSSDRMFAMINGVLRYSEISSAKKTFEHVNLGNIVDAVQTDLELLIAEKKATIECKDLPMVFANADLVHQLFYNLINNSLKFAQSDRPAEIRVSSRDTKVNGAPYVEIAIEDNGIGFERQFAQDIFGTFVRLNPKDLYEGSGLGLALCKRIVERYGGSISAEGKKGTGSIFRFTLPA